MLGGLTNGNQQPAITVNHLTMAYGSFVLMRDLNFTINHGDIFIIMGGSGSGKSTLLRNLIGLNEPAGGEIFYGDQNFTKAGLAKRQEALTRVGVLFQSGALWSSMTLMENVGLPLEEYTDLNPDLDPEILFFDEPSAGLDPISSRLLDDLILDLRDSLGATVVVVTHELASIFTIGNNSIFLDAETRTMIAGGDPKDLLAHSKNPTVHRFLTRGEGERL